MRIYQTKYGLYMDKIIKEVLTNKEVRSAPALMAFVATGMSVGQPWTVA